MARQDSSKVGARIMRAQKKVVTPSGMRMSRRVSTFARGPSVSALTQRAKEMKAAEDKAASKVPRGLRPADEGLDADPVRGRSPDLTGVSARSATPMAQIQEARGSESESGCSSDSSTDHRRSRDQGGLQRQLDQIRRGSRGSSAAHSRKASLASLGGRPDPHLPAVASINLHEEGPSTRAYQESAGTDPRT